MADYSDFYQSFYSTFLTTANGLPVNSMWLVSIVDIPTATIQKYTEDIEGWHKLGNSPIKAATVASPNQKNGLIVATGVKIVGDSINVRRDGIKNSGYIQGLVSDGREGFPLLNIAFVENNVSFVDYVLRPWQIAVAHRSLKEFDLKADLDVVFLTRTGPNSPVAERKRVKYYGCCPVNIDEQEYNYSGSDMYKLRQVQFSYQKYEVITAAPELLGLIGGGATDGFFGLVDRLKDELGRQFGADGIGDYVGGIVDRAVSFGGDLINTTATSIVTNTAGGVQSIVDSAINSLEGKAAGLGRDLVDSIDDAVSDAIGGSASSDEDTPAFEHATHSTSKAIGAAVDTAKGLSRGSSDGILPQKIVNQDDTPMYEKQIQQQIAGTPAEIPLDIPVNQDDILLSPRSSTNTELEKADSNNPEDYNADTFRNTDNLSQFTEKRNPVNDARNGGQLLEDDIPSKAQITNRESLEGFIEKEVDPNDYVTRTADISYIVRPIK